jgi:PAS domain S-box-containing protein
LSQSENSWAFIRCSEGFAVVSSPVVPLSHLALPGLAFDLNDRIVAWNAAAARLYGLPEAEALGQSVLLFVPHDTLDDFRAAVELVKKSGTWHGELLTLTASHQVRLVETAWSFVKDGSASACIVALHTDITNARQEAEIAKQQAVRTALLTLLRETNRVSDVSSSVREMADFFLAQPDTTEQVLFAGGGRTILWVCDDPLRRECYRLLLESFNYRVLAVPHGVGLNQILRDRNQRIHAALVTPSHTTDVVSDIWRVYPLLPILALDPNETLAEPGPDHPVSVVRTRLSAQGLLSLLSLALSESTSG